MMFSDEAFRQRLRSMIEALPCRSDNREDLHQEVLIHLLDLERKRPQQSASWYLQACRFHANHVLSQGRSVDSPKRSNRQVPLPEDPDEADEMLNPPANRNGLFFSSVSANNIEELLARRLSRTERKIQALLVEGFSLREIGVRLGISHTAVLLCRTRIAEAARRLGLRPFGQQGRRPGATG